MSTNFYEYTIKGVVQGVGFRPYIYKQCTKHNLKGYIQNIGTGVKIVINDPKILQKILVKIPALARIDTVQINPYSGLEKFNKFEIKESNGEGFAEIPPDLFLCEDCKKELHQLKDRHYKYYFNTCTNCGPRYSITYRNPYDRPNTSMKTFKMCNKCQSEYTNPTDRRYHAQTIACPDCGPKLTLLKNNTQSKKEIVAENAKAIYITTRLIKEGHIVAIKGVGGFHLACNLNPKTIKILRKSTKRKHKPYAVMCKDLQMVNKIAYVSETEKELLASIQRPIVALKKKISLDEVSELHTIGVMLPYTALHYLLFDHLNEPIIMTSANIADEPITTEENDQWVEYILTHDRKIVNSVDDSVMTVTEDKPIFLRRSRGFVPQSIDIGGNSKLSILAMGAEMNNTFSVLKDEKIYISPHMGNTANWPVFKKYQDTIKTFLKLLKVEPGVIVSDLHPNLNTSVYAQKLAGKLQIPLVKVQHHLAHAYSVAAEYKLDDFTAVICDGIGYGEDEAVWGGEIFSHNKRIGQLEYQFQLGGDEAANKPIKMLMGILNNFMSFKDLQKLLQNHLSNSEFSLLHTQLEKRINTPLTSSCGRVLDAASGLLNICQDRDYDGRAAILLDNAATTPYNFKPQIKKNILLTTPLFEYLVKNLHKDKNRLAATVLQYIAEGLYEVAKQENKPILFSGGCAYSRYMSSFLIKQGVKINTKVPAGDGGISMGQISYYLANSGK